MSRSGSETGLSFVPPGRPASLAMPPRDPPQPTGRGVVRFVNEAALVAAVRAGSTDAAGILYDTMAPMVDRTLYRMLGPDIDLEDLRQDVFVTALRRLDDLDDPSRLGAWLRGMAVLVAKQTIERRVRRRRWLFWVPDEALPDVAAPGDGADADVDRAAARAVYLLLDKLPTDERLVFTLRKIDECPLAEIAETLSLSLATVKRRLARATERFDTLAESHPALHSWTKRGRP